MALTTSTYTPAGKGQYHQDCAISAATLADGTLAQRLDTLAFPRKGTKKTGTVNGHAVPKAAKKTHGVGS